MPGIRTDMALEAFENAQNGSVDGVRVNRWETDGVEITEVLVTDNEAAQLLGKPRGTYLTLECPLLLERDPDARLAVSALLALSAGEVPVYMHLPAEKITLLSPREDWCSADEACLGRLRDALGAENVVLKEKN